jgi:photosystem II stability/assembly factor-like uncharacterized protein
LISLRFKLASATVLFYLLTATSVANPLSWFPFGPDGGDARSFAADPHDHAHLYLGTTNGWIYETETGGAAWSRLARVGKRDDLVLDNIVIDPTDSKHILVGAWVLGSTDGGLFSTTDGGLTWSDNPGLKGQSVLALTDAASDPKTLVAGTLKGVFRSTDNGATWTLISPPGSQEIHEVESIAIDPTNPKIIYAGTWHLPWKTTDGGEHWHNIKQGIIEDSDVFSIIVDPKQPSTVYASACSGIYKSDDAGEKFTKIQGIPSTARRTRVLMQDPEHLQTVFAGTTEGLFRSDDSGAFWNRMTADDVIVNDVYVDPTNSQRVLLATDRGGVLASDDGGLSFHSSNVGFSARQVTSMTSDLHTPANLYIGVVNDKRWGGVFASTDGGLRWSQRADGLDGHDVFSLAESVKGTVVAGTERGLYIYDPVQQLWLPSGALSASREGTTPSRRPAASRRRSSRTAQLPVDRSKAEAIHPATGRRIESGVSAISLVGDDLYAVTTDGLFTATDPAGSWHLVDGPTSEPWRYLGAAPSGLLLASLHSLTLSTDSGKSWHMVPTPSGLTQIGAVAVDDSGALWVGGREGIFVSTTNGATWQPLKDLFVPDVNDIFYDRRGHRLLVTSNGASTMAYSVHLPDRATKAWVTGWDLRFVRPVGDYLIGATFFDGVVLQPRMVASK